MGSAINGSIAISATGRKAKSIIVTIGATRLLASDGSCLSSCTSSFVSRITINRLGIKRTITNTVNSNPKKAGKRLANITDERSAPKLSAAIIVLGLGEMIFPHFPPPIIATNNTEGDNPNRLPMERATGATVITATSINTPTAQSNMVAKAKAPNTRFSPNEEMIALDKVAAAPVLIRTPDNTPAVRIRIMAGVTSFTPSVIIFTVSTRGNPPNKPPTIAPAIKL